MSVPHLGSRNYDSGGSGDGGQRRRRQQRRRPCVVDRGTEYDRHYCWRACMYWARKKNLGNPGRRCKRERARAPSANVCIHPLLNPIHHGTITPPSHDHLPLPTSNSLPFQPLSMLFNNLRAGEKCGARTVAPSDPVRRGRRATLNIPICLVQSYLLWGCVTVREMSTSYRVVKG